MPERNYRGVKIASGQTAQLQPTGPARAPQRQAQTQPSLVAEALQGLLSIGQQYAAKNVESVAETQYLEGVRAANMQESVDSVESDMLSAPFVRGGYNMQTYRMEQAAFAEEMQEYIKGPGKKDTPEEFAKVLKERAGSGFSESLSGLSLADQSRALASQAELEQGINTAQVKAYKANVIQEAAQRYTTQGNQINAALTTARADGDDEAFSNNARRAALMVEDILNGDSLPAEMRPAVAKEYMLSLLSTDNAQVVEDLRDSGLLDNMDHASRVDLDTAIRKSRSRTEAEDNYSAMQDRGEFRARLAAGLATEQEVAAYTEQGVARGIMSAKDVEARWKEYYKSRSNGDTNRDVFQALMSGDVGRLHALGYDVDEAIMLYDQNQAQQEVPLNDRILSSLQMGLKMGSVPAKIGSQISMAVQAAANNPEEMNKEQGDLLNATFATMQMLKQDNPAAVANLLNSVPESERDLLAYAMRAPQRGITPVEAIKQATAQPEIFKAMEPYRKAGVTNKVKAAITSHINEEMGAGWTDKVANLVGIGGQATEFGRWSQARMQTLIEAEARMLADDPDRAALFMGDAQSVEDIVDIAAGNVAQRSVPVGGSVLTMPRGVPVSEYFGAATKTKSGRDRLGEVLYEMYPTTSEDTFMGFGWEAGTLYAKETDAMGTVLNQTPVDNRAAGAAVQQMVDAAIGEGVDAARGRDFAVPEGNFSPAFNDVMRDRGVLPQVNVSGNNTAGVSRRDTMRWRLDLLKEGNAGLDADAPAGPSKEFEQVTDASLHSGKRVARHLAVTADQATEELATQAFRFSRAAGVSDPAAVIELATEAFKLGDTSEFGKVAQAIRDKDWEGFQEEARKAPWYEEQTPEGIEHFISMMQVHFE